MFTANIRSTCALQTSTYGGRGKYRVDERLNLWFAFLAIAVDTEIGLNPNVISAHENRP